MDYIGSVKVTAGLAFQLSPNLISAAIGHDWVLVYSTFKHGISLRTLYRNMLSCELPETAVVLLVRDDQNKVGLWEEFIVPRG